MKNLKIITAIGVLFFLASCSETGVDSNPTKKPTKNEGLIIGDPLDCGLDSLTVFPVGCSYEPVVIEGEEASYKDNQDLRLSNVTFAANSVGNYYDKAAKVEYINDDNENYDIRNLLFYNLNTGESYPLVNDSIHILSFAVHKEFKNPMIIYRVVKEDYNKDKKYDSRDPVMLYVSKLNGADFQAVTPPDEFYIEYTLYAETNSILIKTAIDSNKDFEFLVDDETNFRSMKLDDPKMSVNIFDDSIKNNLRKFN
jgi:hypothetical protein